MTTYTDYAYYAGTFLGTAITEADFPRLALRASAVIDQITFNRAASDTTNTTAIKNAACAVAEELQAEDRAGADGIQSESQGRYSVTYAAHSNKMKSNIAKQHDAASVWLANTGLLFAGFADGEYGGTTDDD